MIRLYICQQTNWVNCFHGINHLLKTRLDFTVTIKHFAIEKRFKIEGSHAENIQQQCHWTNWILCQWNNLINTPQRWSVIFNTLSLRLNNIPQITNFYNAYHLCSCWPENIWKDGKLYIDCDGSCQQGSGLSCLQ